MSSARGIVAAVAVVLAVLVTGCRTPREKTAPCKRPANLMTYASVGGECGSTGAINPDSAAALLEIQVLASGVEE